MDLIISLLAGVWSWMKDICSDVVDWFSSSSESEPRSEALAQPSEDPIPVGSFQGPEAGTEDGWGIDLTGLINGAGTVLKAGVVAGGLWGAAKVGGAVGDTVATVTSSPWFTVGVVAIGALVFYKFFIASDE